MSQKLLSIAKPKVKILFTAILLTEFQGFMRENEFKWINSKAFKYSYHLWFNSGC